MLKHEIGEASNQVFDQQAVTSLLDRVGRNERRAAGPSYETSLSFETLYANLLPAEAQVIQQLLALNPSELGFLGPFVSMEEPPVDLATIENQTFTRDGQELEIARQYLPQAAWNSFKNLQRAISQDIGSRLMVESGYRSPAYQALVFLSFLEKSNFDLKYTANGVALPGYSQHGDPQNTALDVINQDGIPNDDQPQLFAYCKEYEWLSKNAAKYGFYLSYPQGNDLGVKFEPWHWRFIETQP